MLNEICTYMKRFVLLLFAALSITDCGDLLTPEPDPADAWIGIYNYIDNYYLSWGNSTKSDTYQGQFSLTKIDKDRVRMSGDWNTTGRIQGNSIYFDFCPQSDANGYYNYTFGAGILGSSNMTFTYSCSGERRYSNGVSYPWRSNGNVYAYRAN